MELLERKELYYGLKNFLLKESQNNNKKKEILGEERNRLESEKNKNTKKLFQTDESGERRKLFSPLNTIFYPSQEENFQDRKLKNLNYKIEKIEEQLDVIDSESDEMQTFLSSLDKIFKEDQNAGDKAEKPAENILDVGEEEKAHLSGQPKGSDGVEGSVRQDISLSGQPKDSGGAEGSLRQGIQLEESLEVYLKNLSTQISSKYNKVEVLFDIADKEKKYSVSENEYIVDLLYHMIQTSVEKARANVFLIEVRNRNGFEIEAEILVDGKKTDHLSFGLSRTRP